MTPDCHSQLVLPLFVSSDLSYGNREKSFFSSFVVYFDQPFMQIIYPHNYFGIDKLMKNFFLKLDSRHSLSFNPELSDVMSNVNDLE